MSGWTTLLEGSVRERALRTVEEISGALRERQWVGGASLVSGLAGVAFLFAELDRVQPQRGHRAHAERFILEAASAIEERLLEPWLYGGFSGIAWSITRLGAMGIPSFEDLEEIDEALLGLVSRRPWDLDYDLVLGLVGLGVYALERMPRPVAVRCLEEIVARLEERSTRAGPGLSWWTPARHLPAHHAALYPEGYFNLGVAHGMPAVVALLALVARAGVAERKARELSLGGARWLLANVLPDSPGARFPPFIASGIPVRPTRSAWCYGDPGVILCLLVTARALSDGELERTVLELAREAARRPVEHCGVREASFCHGSTGLGHLYNRLYQATGEPLFKEAATSWIHWTLEQHQPGEGLGGYFFWYPVDPTDETKGNVHVPNGGLLSGASGIALTLLAACHPFPPTWDGVLLAAIPE